MSTSRKAFTAFQNPKTYRTVQVIALSLVLATVFSTIAIQLAIRRQFIPPTGDYVRCCGPYCRDRIPDVEEHYDKAYFDWQTKLGLEKAKAENWDVKLGTRPTDTVADLGAGGGHILAVLNVSKRIAVEISPTARRAMHQRYPGRITTYQYPELVPDNSLDLLFTTSAIEHFECPLTELREMCRKVKVGGRVVVGIKNEGIAYGRTVRDDDVNQHVYTWSRQELYNLVKHAGFQVDRVEPTVEEMKNRASEWGPEVYTTYHAFFMHWAYGVKKA